LGLFLSKAIVEAHGGQIWARSEPGRGTTFFISLPVAQREDDKPLSESTNYQPPS